MFAILEAALRDLDKANVELMPQVVFCHNDLQGGNILLATDKSNIPNFESPESLTFIDYEYSAYNFRAFDVANHFMEWTFDYSKKEAPFFRYEPQKWPSEDQQQAFVRRYLNTTAPELFDFQGITSPSLAEKNEIQNYVDWFLTSVQLHTMSSHLLYSTWGLAQYFSSSIRFGYLVRIFSTMSLMNLYVFFRTIHLRDSRPILKNDIGAFLRDKKLY